MARRRLRAPWLSTIGPALLLAELAAVVVTGLVAGAAPAPTAAAAVLGGLAAAGADLHRSRLVLAVVEDLPGLLFVATVVTAVLAVGDGVSVSVVLVALPSLVLAHAAVYAVTELLRRTGRLRRRALVVGTGRTARRLGGTLVVRSDLGLRPVGVVGTGDRSRSDQARGLPLPLVGPVAALPQLVAESRVAAVVVAGPVDEAATDAVGRLLLSPVDVFVSTRLAGVGGHARHPAELVGGVPVVRLHRRGDRLPVRAAKRVVEVLVAAESLVVLLPLAVLVAVPVRLETGGVVVVRTRLDEAGQPVRVRRFRTRRARSVSRPGTTFTVAVLGAVGPVGRLLRRTRLDALPEVVAALLRHVRRGVPGGVTGGLAGGVAGRVAGDHAGAEGAAGAEPIRSAAAPGTDQTQVDPGKLAR